MARRGVIFDMDGVLVDSYQPHFRSWQLLASNHGLQFTEEQFAESFGKTTREMMLHHWSGLVSEDDVPAWDAEKEATYRNLIRANCPVMPGAGELVRDLHKAGFDLAIGSSGPAENVEAVLGAINFGNLFAATVNGHDVTKGKPHPDIFLSAAGKLGLTHECCVVIEDAPLGIEAAKLAQMPVVAITGTADRAALSDANMVVDSLHELSAEVIASLLPA